MDNFDDLLKEIDDYINGFNDSVSGIQEDILNKINLFIKDLTVKNGNVVASMDNLRKIKQLKPLIEKAILSPAYQESVSEFVDSFNSVSKIQDSFFAGMVEDYTAPVVLAEVRKIAVNDTIDKLTERGLGQVTNQISDLIKTNITSNASYAKLVKQTRDFLTDTKTGDGALVKYAKGITTDALNQYSANYTKIITDDLGLDYFGYVGALVGHSRQLCKDLVAKHYIHKSEIPEIVKGLINGEQIPLNSKTGLPVGMIPGTDASNFQTLRGGYGCNHQMMPISKFRVPKEIRAKFEKA